METKDISDLKANPKNPRTLSEHDGKALAKSMSTFGDLSCIVYNIRTQQLVGGHQRVSVLTKLIGGNNAVSITERFDTPDDVGTVALGYVTHDNKKFAYREVDWDEPKELAANIAANRIQGEFQLDMLAQINYELSQLENGQDLLALTGQTVDEINKLLGMVSGEGEEDDKYTKEIVAPTYEPTGEKPSINDLVNLDKTNKLLAEIETADIAEEDKHLLRLSAQRHNVFNFENIANYYAHSDAKVQDLMEKSAMVIIDYNKAVENGYTQLTHEIMEVQSEDYPDGE